MRPHKYFVCVNELSEIFAVVKGQAAARKLCAGRRSYWSFRSELDAQEFASWWTYEAPLRAAAWKADFDRREAERRAALKAVGVRPLV
ncbi:hypothetical protein [Devosia chinhatensis]|uniref:hypothetical protein n=1 Tax=Devosia chinhatensis TaxID=429727 RepID=UPI000A9892FB|nr:hypothetical protein [Devosia chinhatensis]